MKQNTKNPTSKFSTQNSTSDPPYTCSCGNKCACKNGAKVCPCKGKRS